MTREKELKLLEEFREALEDFTVPASKREKRARFLANQFETKGIEMRLASAIEFPDSRDSDLGVVKTAIEGQWRTGRD